MFLSNIKWAWSQLCAGMKTFIKASKANLRSLNSTFIYALAISLKVVGGVKRKGFAEVLLNAITCMLLNKLLLQQ